MGAIETGYQRIAYISRPKGIKGEVVLQPAADLPLTFFEDCACTLWVVPPLLEGVRTTRLLALKAQAKDEVARLEGVENPDMARELAGRWLLAETVCVQEVRARAQAAARRARAAARIGEGAEVEGVAQAASGLLGVSGAAARRVLGGAGAPVSFEDEAALLGLSVVDAQGGYGFLGTIREVRTTSAQTLWVVDGGAYGEVLIPAVSEFICEIVAGQEVRVTLPAGLVELNH